MKEAKKRKDPRIGWLGQCHGLCRDGTRCLNKGLPEFCRMHRRVK